MNTCAHGQTGFCWDDATPEQRQYVNFLHAHAYAWVTDIYGLKSDAAEGFACDYVREHWDDDKPCSYRAFVEHYPGRYGR